MSTEVKYNPVYNSELAVITEGHRQLNKLNQSMAELRDEYRTLLNQYERLFKSSRKISAISDVQGNMLKQRENDIQNLLDHANQGFLTVGPNLRVNKSYSRECVRIFGRKIGGADITELLWGGDPALQAAVRERLIRLYELPAEQSMSQIIELPPLVDVGDRRIAIEYKRISSTGSGLAEDRLIMLIMTDVTARLATEERIRYLSSHDSLTSLHNRSYMEPLLDKMPRSDQFPVSVVVIDMNGLKLSNDVFGHRAGDNLLVRAAELLKQVFVRPAVISRWGGDEFVVLLYQTDETACEAFQMSLEAGCMSSEADPIKLSMAVGSATIYRQEDTVNAAMVTAEKLMYKHKLLESKKVRSEMLDGVTQALLAKGIENERNMEKLHEWTAGFARHLGIAEGSPDMRLIKLLVQLHDAGNLALPSPILSKPGPLDAEEWEIVKSHSEIGYRMAQSIGEYALADAILGMHEHWDGSGYPYGLAGEQIPYFSRVLAIVDAYDVMTHDQVYKKSVSHTEALHKIRDGAGKQFDPELVEAFLRFMGSVSDAGGRIMER